MHRADNSNFLLFIEPKLEDKEETPVHDELQQVLRMAIQDAVTGVSNYDRPDEEAIFSQGVSYKGFHTSCDGVSSANFDLLLPNGMITNTLALHYLTWFRGAIPASEIDKLENLQRYYGRVNSPLPLTRW